MILENLVDQCDSLPAAPTLLRDLIDQFNDENASLQDLATLMERDPAICAQLLRLAIRPIFS